MARVLLINPSYSRNYGSAKAGLTNPVFPTLGLATVAGAALARGHDVRILDLSNRRYDWREVRTVIEAWGPEVVAITATTPLMNQLRDLSILCKDISPDILVVGGGPHVSALPRESLEESALDLVVVGEGDITFADICDGLTPSSIPGLYYRDGAGAIHSSGERPLVANLDDLPMPAWHLYHAPDYRRRVSRLLARRPPVTMAEFSRGCVYRCDFCASKMTMGLGYRQKSPERCAEEVRVMAGLGWREFMLADDIFTSDRDWATRVSQAVGAAQTGMLWSCTNGIRVESAHEGLFRAMRAAGCYRVSFGLETGNDSVLQSFGKGGRATVEQGRRAVDIARGAGLETSGYFLLGLSEDTEATMADTITYARSLPLDVLKFGVTVAFPGTSMFNDLVAAGLIRSYDWDRYQIYSQDALFVHRHLGAEVVPRYMASAYRRAILTNLPFLARRIVHGLRTGQVFWDVWYGLRFLMLPATSADVETGYYAQARWPTRDYGSAPPSVLTYPHAHPSR
jgi:anaerobic magnesium-protoporphyrin IX monomethyl ester cyclase